MANPRFKGQRRQVAVVLNGQKRTLYEIAKALGRRSGDVQKVVRQMHSEGILGPLGEEPTRGTEFWLDESYTQALEDSLRSDQPPGVLSTEQDLLVIRARERAALERVLSRSDLTAAVAWVARLGADNELLLAVSRDAAPTEVNTLRSALEAAGVKVKGHRAVEFADAETMRLRFAGSQEVAQRLAGDIA